MDYAERIRHLARLSEDDLEIQKDVLPIGIRKWSKRISISNRKETRRRTLRLEAGCPRLHVGHLQIQTKQSSS